MFNDWNNLPDFIAFNILDRLDFNDLKNSSLVSKNWYSYIGNNSKLMNKIRLKVEGWQDIDVVSNLLMQSQRKYTNIRINNLNPTKNFPFLLKQEWKFVKLEQIKFGTTLKFYDYMRQFGECIEELILWQIYFPNDYVTCEQRLVFPNLKRLKMQQVGMQAFEVFGRYPNVESLSFDIPAFATTKRSYVVNFFRNFESLPHIKELTICRNSLYALSPQELVSMENIIKSIAGTLKELCLVNWGCSDTFERLFNHVKIESFHISFCSVPNIDNLQVNVYLKALKIYFFSQPMWFKKVFELLPNLEHLYIPEIRKEIVYFAAKYLKNLATFDHNRCLIELNGESVETTRRALVGYEYLGPNEVFNITDQREVLDSDYADDEHLNMSYALNYYNELRRHEPNINQNIDIRKVKA